MVYDDRANDDLLNEFALGEGIEPDELSGQPFSENSEDEKEAIIDMLLSDEERERERKRLMEESEKASGDEAIGDEAIGDEAIGDEAIGEEVHDEAGGDAEMKEATDSAESADEAIEDPAAELQNKDELVQGNANAMRIERLRESMGELK